MKKEYWWLILIIIIATYMRVANLQSIPPGLYPDEAMNGNNALEALATHDFKVFYPENNGREGLFINIQALFLSLLGNEPWVLRLPSAIFGILTVLGMYFLTRELFRDKTLSFLNPLRSSNDSLAYYSPLAGRKENGQTMPNGGVGFGRIEVLSLLSTFLLAVSFWHINFSRIGFRAIMAPFFLIWGVYFLLLALRQIKEQKTSKVYILDSVFSGIFYGLGFHSYIAYRATPIIILFILTFYFFEAKRAAWLKHFYNITAIFLISSFIAALPLNIHFLQNPQDFFGRTSQVSVFSSDTPLKDLVLNTIKTAGMFNFVGDWNWRHNYAGKPLLFWPVGILFIIGVIVGIRTVFRKTNYKIQMSNQVQNPKSKNIFLKFSHLNSICNLTFGIWILFIWLIVAALPVVVSNEGLPHALRAILMIPPVIIISALGGLWLFKRFENKVSANKLRAATLIILILIIVEIYNSYFIIWAKNPNTAGAFSRNYVEIAKELNTLPKEMLKFVVINASGIEVRGIPMPAQTIMFITDTFREEERVKKNIRYITPQNIPETQFPENAFIGYLN